MVDQVDVELPNLPRQPGFYVERLGPVEVGSLVFNAAVLSCYLVQLLHVHACKNLGTFRSVHQSWGLGYFQLEQMM